MSAPAAPREAARLQRQGWDPPPPLYEKLVPAPHTISSDRVADIQRGRLCGAMVHAVAEHGYGKVTVTRLHRLAGVSKHTLYDRFGHDDAKRRCLLGAIDAVLVASLKRAQTFQRRGDEWSDRLALTLGALAQDVARHPGAASVVLVEAYDPQAGALETLATGWERFEELLAGSFSEADGQDPPPLVVKGILAGVAHVARAHLLAGRELQLPRRVVDELAAWACACCSGAAVSPVAAAASSASETSMIAPEIASRGDGELCDEHRWMLEACARLAGEGGYGSLTISRIEKDAQVPRGALRRHFTDVRECFLDAYEMVCGDLLRCALVRTYAPSSWPSVMPHPMLERLTDRLATRPDLARIVFCEVLAAGPAGVRAQTRLLETFAGGLAGRVPPERCSSHVVHGAGAAAVWAVMGHLSAHGGAQRLPATCQVLARLMPPVGVASHPRIAPPRSHAVHASAVARPRNQEPNRR